jgi:hypothetical protein
MAGKSITQRQNPGLFGYFVFALIGGFKCDRRNHTDNTTTGFADQSQRARTAVGRRTKQ